MLANSRSTNQTWELGETNKRESEVEDEQLLRLPVDQKLCVSLIIL